MTFSKAYWLRDGSDEENTICESIGDYKILEEEEFFRGHSVRHG